MNESEDSMNDGLMFLLGFTISTYFQMSAETKVVLHKVNRFLNLTCYL